MENSKASKILRKFAEEDMKREDLSWYQQRYTFDKDGNYIGEEEIDSY